MKIPQISIILKVLEENKDWTPGYSLIKMNTKWGYLGSSADRFARWLAEDGTIEKKREGRYTYYRLKVTQPSLI